MRVYVSSTYKDLVECRQVVHTTLRKLRQDDVAMEYYVAEPDRPVDVCLRDVRDAELYIGLFAWRYGHVPDGYTQSITELEYRTAVEAGIPCLIFLLGEDAMWPRNMVDRGDAADQIEALRAELAEKHTVTFFANAQELGTAVATAMSRQLVQQSDIPEKIHQLDPEMLRQYFQRLRQQYGRLDLDALTPPEREEYLQIRLESVFVEQYVREDPPPIEVPRELLQRLLAQGEIDEDELPDGFDVERLREARAAYRAKPRVKAIGVIQGPARCVVILGDPGSGKSTLARFLMLSLAGLGEDLGPLTGHLPLLIELKRYVALRAEGSCRSILDLLDHLWDTQGLGIAQGELGPYLAGGGPAVAVFDGLDEVFEPRQREEIAGEIAAFAVRFPSVRIVVTSRIAGYRRSLLTNAGFAHYTLQDLDEDQIAEFLRSWYALALSDRPDQAGNRQARLLLAVRESRPIGELAGNPLLLTILAIIGKHQALPRERWKVYDHAARVLVQHWDINRQLQAGSPVAEYLGEDDKREMLRRLAWSMQTAEAGMAGNFVHREELQRTFEAYLTERYASDPATAKRLASLMIDQFRERNFILSRYGPDLYGFVHRAFMEFFCADSIVQKFQRHQVMSLDDLTTLFTEHAHDSEWREILRLLASVLAEHHTAAIIERLLQLDRPWPLGVFGQRPPLGLALAVECLADVANPRAVESASAVLNEIVLLLEHGVGIADARANDVLGSRIIPAARAIGEAWPDRDAFAAWYEHRGCRIVWTPISTHIARLAAAVLADRPAALLPMVITAEITDGRAWTAVRAGIEELVRRSPRVAATGTVRVDPPCTPSDPPSRLVRRLEELANAERRLLRALGTALHDRLAPDDPRITDTLRERLRNDPDADVFRAAAQALLRRHPRDPEVRQIILDKTRTEVDAYGWELVRDLVNAQWPDDPDFWPFRAAPSSDLLDDARAANLVAQLPTGIPIETIVNTLLAMTTHDDSYQRKHNALALLDRLAPDDPRTADTLRERLRNDPDADVFRAAAQALLRRHPHDPEVRQTLLDKAKTTADERWWKVLRDLATTHWPDDPDFWPLRAIPAPELLDNARATDLAAHPPTDIPTESIVNTLLTMTTQGTYRLRHNALALLDHLAPDDPRTTDTLRDRLHNDDDDDVFRAAAQALLRRHPRDPEVRQTLLDKAKTTADRWWWKVLRDLADTYWPDDSDFGPLRAQPMSDPFDDSPAPDDEMWADIRRQVSRDSVGIEHLPALDRAGPQDLPLPGFDDSIRSRRRPRGT
ncbi:MAG TPA: DUF4062 domain-containing protein [Actinophytocola sp.]|uniref:DUF4062 domain-containing protein n=1 Tax=Actinophytocola sp. TaxID=1872138 RepID=UPI002DDCC0E3|nr:DUF4062 domain-containing protein [Actinophytocola sp.]HEV2781728.1 DUF4062 domain-containing protein [Actinophytocola sp.]